MKRTAGRALLVVVVFVFAVVGESLRPAPTDASEVHGHASKGNGGADLQEEVYATGSSLPDCSHACGACSPCVRVTVSYKCAMPEPCPMVYRCMCRGKCYPVPSS